MRSMAGLSTVLTPSRLVAWATGTTDVDELPVAAVGVLVENDFKELGDVAF